MIPAYYIIFVPLNALYIFLEERTICESVLSLTAIEFWLYHRGAWFISLIIPLYFISPYLYKIMKGGNKWYWASGLIILLTLVCSIPVSNKSQTNVLNNLICAFGRSPIFFLGMAIAQGCMKKEKICILWPVSLFALYFPIHWLIPNAVLIWMFVPLTLLLLLWTIRWMIKCYWIEKFLSFMGRISLESYLLNISINSLLSVLITYYCWSSPLLYGKYLQYSIVVIIGTLLAYLVNCFCYRFSAR